MAVVWWFEWTDESERGVAEIGKARPLGNVIAAVRIVYDTLYRVE